MDEHNYIIQDKNFFYNKKSLRKVSSFFLFLSFVFALVEGFIYLCNLPYFTINNFVIYTQNLNINQNILQKQLSQKRYHFFSFSLDEIKKTFEQIPSVSKVELFRNYPNTLEVKLFKHQPYAKWGVKDDMYINTKGEIYQGSSYDEARVSIHLEGEGENAKFILNQYKFLQTLFSDKIISLVSNNQKNLTIKLANGQTFTLGREQNEVLAKKLAFWHKAWNTLKSNPIYTNVTTFDLRYDGFTMEVPKQSPENIQTQNKNVIDDQLILHFCKQSSFLIVII